MKNVHVGWGPVGMTPIKDRMYIQLNKLTLTGIKGTTSEIKIVSKHNEIPIWQSSDESIATVDNGIVHFIDEGQAVITVTIGKLVAKCKVTVVLTKEEQLIVDLQKGEATLPSDIEKTVIVDYSSILNLNGHTLKGELFTEQNGEIIEGDTDSIAIWAKQGSYIQVSGDGKVEAQAARYSMAVWAQGGTVVIEGGEYTNAGEGADLIYASEGGKVIITGGIFKAGYKRPETPGVQEDFVALNLKNNGADGCSIVVKGGTFYGYDPANNKSEIPAINFVAEGYESVKIGEFFHEETGKYYPIYEVRKIEQKPDTPEPEEGLDTSKMYYGVIPNNEIIPLSDITEEWIISKKQYLSSLESKGDQKFEIICDNKYDTLIVLIADPNLSAKVEVLGQYLNFSNTISDPTYYLDGKIIGDFKLYALVAQGSNDKNIIYVS